MPDFKIFYRGNLPHWQPPGATLFFTWRLHGSLPRETLTRLAEEHRRIDREPPREDESERDRAIRHDKILFAMMDEALDRPTTGPLWLKDDRLAKIVTDAFFHHDGVLYNLFAFVVMANHAHLLLRPKEVEPTFQSAGSGSKAAATFVPISRITQSLKGYTSRECNHILGRTGHPFWQHESYDHWARDERELTRIWEYIEGNPVKAGLTAKPEA